MRQKLLALVTSPSCACYKEWAPYLRQTQNGTMVEFVESKIRGIVEAWSSSRMNRSSVVECNNGN
jgi:hypothetical protein